MKSYRYSFSNGVPIVHKNILLPNDNVTPVSCYGVWHDIIHHHDGDFSIAGEVKAFGMIYRDMRHYNRNSVIEEFANTSRNFWRQHIDEIPFTIEDVPAFHHSHEVAEIVKAILDYMIMPEKMIAFFKSPFFAYHTQRGIDRDKEVIEDRSSSVMQLLRSKLDYYLNYDTPSDYQLDIEINERGVVTVTTMNRDDDSCDINEYNFIHSKIFAAIN